VEKLARNQAIGRKYSMRLDQSVSGDLQKLRDRLAAAKAELSAIRADVVTVTSPVRRPPPDLPRVAAVPPMPKQAQPATSKPLPPPRQPVYSLHRALPIRPPVVKNVPDPEIAAGGAIAAGRKLGVEIKQQITEEKQVDSRTGRQKAAVGKPLVRTGVAQPRLVRPTPQKKPTVTSQQPQQVMQRRAPPVQTSAKPLLTPATRRLVETQQPARQKLPRVTNAAATAPRKRPVKKRGKISDSSEPKDRGRPFPAAVDKQYTMKKFTAQRESEQSASIPTTNDKPSLSNVIRETRDVSEVADTLHQATTSDQPQTAWLQLPINANELTQRRRSDVKFGEFPRSSQKSPELLGHKFKSTVDLEEQEADRVSKTLARNIIEESTIPDQTEDAQIVSISAAQRDMLKMAMGTGENREDRDMGSEKDADEVIVDTKTKNANEMFSESANYRIQMMQSSKRLVVDSERLAQKNEGGFKGESEKIPQNDEGGQTVHQTVHDDAKKNEEKPGEEWTELDRDEARVSLMSVFDDHQTLPENDYELDGFRLLERHLTSSTEAPLSTLSDNDTELAALSDRSSIASHRNFHSPDFPNFRSPTGDVQALDAGQVKVVTKEQNMEIIVDLDYKAWKEVIEPAEVTQDDDDGDDVRSQSFDERSTGDVSLRSSVSRIDLPLKVAGADTDMKDDECSVRSGRHDDDDFKAGLYCSDSGIADKDQMLQPESSHRDSFEEDTDEVDPAVKVPDENKDLEREVALEKKLLIASVVDGKMNERLHGDVTSRKVEEAVAENDTGSIADEHITKEMAERVLSNAGLTKDTTTELEHDNSFADDDFIAAAISGTSNYLEREYGLPSLTPLNMEEGPDEALRGEGPQMYHDDEATRLYPLGEDGLPDFGAEYELGFGTEESDDEDEEHAVITGGYGQLLSEPEDNVINKLDGMKTPEIMHDEVSILPTAAQSEDWDDALYDLSIPSSAAELQKLKARAEREMTSSVAEYQESIKEKMIVKTEVVEHAVSVSADLRDGDHPLETV